jgi:hypothetical protein
MASEQSSMIGSGTIPFTTAILPPDERGLYEGARGLRYGTQVVLINPEDLVAVDKFATSGVTIGTTPVQIAGPGITPLPRIRGIRIYNASASASAVNVLWIGPREDFSFIEEGIPIFGSAAGQIVSEDFPFLHNMEVWIRSALNSVPTRIMYY